MSELNQDEQELVERWPLIQQFGLQPGMNIAVVGAYKGLAMSTLDKLYEPASVYGFEPQPWAAAQAIDRLHDHPSCTVIPSALGTHTFQGELVEWHTDAASLVNPHARPEQGMHAVEVIDAKVLALYFPSVIDLMVMNIEGYEYELLPYLRELDILPKKIHRLAVQFHLGFGNDENVEELMGQLDKDYERYWSEFPAWVYWRKDD